MQIPNNWTEKDNGIFRKIEFKDFKQALAKMVEIGIEAEKAMHHPEWKNVYNTLDIFLTTHDEGGLTEKDIKLAEKINALVD